MTCLYANFVLITFYNAKLKSFEKKTCLQLSPPKNYDVI